ncbi:MAG: substrate-binding domain-containing protein [Oscillospiraceae bacterium]|nr:substrate-binding domain-containing protein [Oscillospiraceae bacterium]
MKKLLSLVLALALCVSMAACSSAPASSEGETAGTETPSIAGTELLVFSGAGLANPVQEIADAFAAETGCTPQIVFAPTGQLIAQIQSTESGDLIIAGAVDELANMKTEEITSTIELVKHIPVLAVAAGNPKNITSVADLGAEGITVLFPDPETTPMGKIAVKAFKEAGIYENIDIAANTTTAANAMTAMAAGQADAAILWKENAATNSAIEILDVPEMEKYIKIVPIAELSYSANEPARTAFVEYMQSQTALDIWAKHGYEVVYEG